MSDITKGDVKISEDETTNRKYLLISVPDFAPDPSGAVAPTDRKGQMMTSYLRLGVPKVGDDIGDELIQHAYDVGVVGFTGELTVPALTSGPDEKVVTVFVDDERNRGDGTIEPLVAAGHGMTQEERYRRHTQHLKSRGGWRDHSDGNRISTTYGDKIEVIRGNYKLVVMGRQDDPGQSQGHEWSGNHVQDWGQGTMPGASVTLEWIQDGYVATPPIETAAAVAADPAKGIEAAPAEYYRGGAWLLINSTERVYQYSRNAGNFRQQQWGQKLETYVGSENPERIGTTDGAGYGGHPTKADHRSYHKVLDDNDLADKLSPSSVGLPRGNPHIIEKTWATRIDTYTGTSGHRIPTIYEETWATTVDSKEDITTKTETSTVGTHTSTSNVTTLTETTNVGTQVSTTFAGAIVDTTFVGIKNETTIGGPMNEITISPAMGEISLCGLKGSIDIVGAAAELSICGIKRALTIGVGKEWKIGDVEEIGIPNKKQLALNQFRAAMNYKVGALNHQTLSLQKTNIAMMQTLKALSVFLGT